MINLIQRIYEFDSKVPERERSLVTEVLDDPDLFDDLFGLIKAEDRTLALRAAGIIEEVTRKNPSYLFPHKQEVLDRLMIPDRGIIWYLLLILPRLELSNLEVNKYFKLCESFHQAKNKRAVRVCALEAIYELSKKNPALKSKADKYIEVALGSPVPSISARARILLKKMDS
jgi:hypothetical protein